MASKTTHICTVCNSMVIPEKKAPGSSTLELAIWEAALLAALFTFGISFLLALGYSIYRMIKTEKVCPECTSKEIIRLNSTSANKNLAGLNFRKELNYN